MNTHALDVLRDISERQNQPFTTEQSNMHGCRKIVLYYKHFNSCDGWAHIKGIMQLDAEMVNQKELQTNTVQTNTKIIGRADNWQTLAFKESLKIKDKKPSMNCGVRACKDLCLF